MKKYLSAVMVEMSRMSTAIILLVVVALFSICGTLLAQDLLISDYQQALGPFWYQVFDIIGLTTVFTSWWYLSLLVILTVSISSCLYRSGPAIWRKMFTRKIPKEMVYSQWPAEEVAVETGVDTLAAQGYRLKAQRQNICYFTKGFMAKLGYFCVHLGVLVLVIGGLITGFVGYRNVVVLADGMAKDQRFKQLASGELVAAPLPFSVKSLGFNIDTYSNGLPKDYSTVLKIQSSAVSETVVTRVNHPVHVGGITFYQSSYGDAGSKIDVLVRGIERATGLPAAQTLQVGQTTALTQDISITVTALEEQSVQHDNQGELVNFGPILDYVVITPERAPVLLRSYLSYPDVVGVRDPEGGVQNAFLGLALDDKQALDVVVQTLADSSSDLTVFTETSEPFLRALPAPERTEMALKMLQARKILAQLNTPVLLQLVDYDKIYYSVLQVAYDPGFYWFIVASILLVVGVYMMIYSRYGRAVLVKTKSKAILYRSS